MRYLCKFFVLVVFTALNFLLGCTSQVSDESNKIIEEFPTQQIIKEINETIISNEIFDNLENNTTTLSAISSIARPDKKQYLDCSEYSDDNTIGEYDCFDVYDGNPEDIIVNAKNSTKDRIAFYGSYVLYDCPSENTLKKYKNKSEDSDYLDREDILRSCYLVSRFVDSYQHISIARNLGVNPSMFFDNPKNPQNFTKFIIFVNEKELMNICEEYSDACTTFDHVYQSLEYTKLDKSNEVISHIMIEGNTMYVYDEYVPENCYAGEIHEHIHVFNSHYLRQRHLWFEEILVRPMIEILKEDVCDFNVIKSSLRSYRNGFISEAIIHNVTTVDTRKINSELPFESFAELYTNKNVCRQAIAMQLNRDALKGGKSYIKKLYKIMQENFIDTDKNIAIALINASLDKAEAENTLSVC